MGVVEQKDDDLITVADAIERAWTWIEPYFTANGYSHGTMEALKELYVHYMHSTIGNYNILGKRYINGKLK